MNEIVPFQFHTATIRTALTEDGTPMFVAKDIAELLEYDQTANALKLCKHSRCLDELNKINDLAPATKWITESDVYRLVMRSNMPKAEVFQDWVVEEVLPAIRQTGSYTAPKAKPAKKDPTLPFITRETKAAIELAKAFGLSGNAALISASGAVVKMHQVNPMDLVGITHLDNVEQALYSTPTELGERLGITGAQMNKRLESAGLQTRQGERWVPTEEGMKHCRIQDTTKRHKSGVMVQQVKWDAAVVEMVREAKIAA